MSGITPIFFNREFEQSKLTLGFKGEFETH